MIFNMNGGGVNLNFKVVGNPQPGSAKENTIWVNTDVDITGRILSPIKPINPTEGMVWILTGDTSAASFEALRIGDYQFDTISPINAKQYVDGAWMNVIAKIYQGGAWIDIACYLYNLGNEYESITGGWQARAWKANSNYGALAPTLTKNAESMTVALSKPGGSTNTASGVVETMKNIDLTSVDTIVATFERVTVGGSAISGQMAILEVAITDRNATYYRDSAVARKAIGYSATGTNYNVVLEVDVSAIKGSHDVCIGLGSYRENSEQSITAVCTSVELK